MNLIGIMSIVILVITILTLVFGVIAYFMYKIREKRNSQRTPTSYEEKCIELGTDYIFFDK
jgi:heme/copper-type cytochrome/quinol oxidase subunit 2